MKKIIFILCLLICLLSGCVESQSYIYFNNLELENDVYYLNVDCKKMQININEYINCSGVYTITFNEKSYNSNINTKFDLVAGENEFLIEFNNNNYKIVIIKAEEIIQTFTINVLDDEYNIISSNEFLTSEFIQIDEIKKLFISKENHELTPYVLYSIDKVNFDEYLLEEIPYNDTIYLIPIYEKIDKVYTIKFIIDNDTTETNILVGEEIVFPGIKEKEGYEFIGWYVGDKKVEDLCIYELSLGDTFTAKYEAIKYKLIYRYDGEEVIHEYELNDKINLLTLTKTGFIFKGWEYNGEIFNDQIWKYLENITLTPIWESNQITLNLETFNGLVDSNTTFNENGEILLPTPIKEGYKFKYWTKDIYFKNIVTSLNNSEYQNEILYAYYELDNDYLKSQFTITRFNLHAASYDEVALFDNTITGMTSKYWYKIAIKKINNEFFVSSLAESGDSISTIGEYDYVIMVYSACPIYNEIASANIEIGDVVNFIIDPSSLEQGSVKMMFSVSTPQLSEELENIKNYLDNKYNIMCEITENIELITSYNDFNIEWVSSNNEVISAGGIYHAPNKSQQVTLTAYVNGFEIYSFTVLAKGTYVSNALATGYIYTPYNTITQNAMNTLDIIYCAFLELDANANWTNLSSITNKINTYIKDKAKISGTKIVISVNQSTSGAFSSIAGNADLRDKLADNIVDVIKSLKLDGVDIDWEVPAKSEAGNFTLMMKAIYDKVKMENSSYLVTAAIGGGKWQPPSYDLTNSIKYMDYVNLMTYSMTSDNSYYQNALYPSTKKATLASCSIDESVKIFNNLNVPNAKILIGIPFYTIVQTDAGGPGSLTGSGKSKWYDVLYDTYPLSDTMKEYFDEECKVPYRYDAVNKIFISFENERSIMYKCQYINELGLAGIMYWQYGQDIDDYLSNAIAKYINA